MKKIVFAGLMHDSNLGDRVIADCTAYLFRQSAAGCAIEFDSVDLAARDMGMAAKLRKKFTRIERYARTISELGLLEKRALIYRDYYASVIKDADMVVVVGGGLVKYRYQLEFMQYLAGLADYAGEAGIPLVLNAVGVEGYDPTSENCLFLKKILNSPPVKVITTRDDLETLRDNYLDGASAKKTALVADPAVFASEVYGITRDTATDTVGIGLVRGQIFEDNQREISERYLIDLYGSLMDELESRSIPFRLFTNGAESDFQTGLKLMKHTGRSKLADEILVPSTPEQLVRIISGFKGVIAARLHSCIIAYSLGIPAVGLVWNDKLAFWGRNTGYPERFLGIDELHSPTIADRLEKAVAEGYDTAKMNRFKRTIKDSVNEITDILC